MDSGFHLLPARQFFIGILPQEHGFFTYVYLSVLSSQLLLTQKIFLTLRRNQIQVQSHVFLR